jgi:hypothetical protein
MKGMFKAGLQAATKIACALLALILFRWTPTTGKGILLYAGLFAGLIVLAIVLSAGNSEQRSG